MYGYHRGGYAYHGGGYMGEYGFYAPPPVIPVWFVGMHQSWFSVMSWMQEEIYEIWMEWQITIRRKYLTPEQRTDFLRKALQESLSFTVSHQVIEEYVQRIMAMEGQLGADQYGHVEMSSQNTMSQVQNTTTTTRTTTTTLTTQQRQQAGQLYWQSLNGTNMDQEQAQQTWNQIVNGQSDQLAEHFLRMRQSGGNQQNMIQQASSQQMTQQQIQQQPQPQQQPVQQYHAQLQQMQRQQMPRQQQAQQPQPHQQVVSQASNLSNNHQSRQQGNPQYQQQIASPLGTLQQTHTTTITTTTTTSQNSSNGYGYQQPQYGQGRDQPHQKTQNPSNPQHLPHQQRMQIESGGSGSVSPPQANASAHHKVQIPQAAAKRTSTGFGRPTLQASGSSSSSAKQSTDEKRKARQLERERKGKQ